MKKSGFIALFLSVMLFALTIFAAGCSSAEKLDKPYGLSIDDENRLTWVSIDEARSYIVSITDINGYSWEETSRRASFSLSDLDVGDYDLKVKAVGNGKNFSNSVWSETYYFHRDYETGCLYKLINNASEYEINSVGSAAGELEIDGMYRGKAVTSVGDGAFRGNKSVEKIVLGNNVSRIGESAFYNCRVLAEVVMPDSITNIGSSAFKSCLALTSVRLSKGLKTISESAFSYCRSLAEIDLTGIETIGESAFSNCDSLAQLVLPESLTSLGDSAFSNALSLKSVTFDSGLKTLGNNAFRSCPELNKIIFADDESLKEIGEYTFAECNSLTDIVLPDGLQTVGGGAFYLSSNLAYAEIPASVTRVGGYAFDGTKIYKNAVDRGDAFVYVGNWLVQIARGNEDSDCPNVRMTGIIADTTGNEERIPEQDSGVEGGYLAKFKSGVIGIADFAFSNCSELIYAEIPLSVKYIGNYAFTKCSKLYRLNTLSGLRRIGVGAFYNCELLQRLYLGEGLETIGQGAFRSCKSLVNPNDRNIIPQSVTQIEPDAFYETGLWNRSDQYGVIYAGNWIVGYTGENYDIIIGNPYFEQSGDDSSVNIADYAFFNIEYRYYMLELQSYFKEYMGFQDYLEYLKNPESFDGWFEKNDVPKPPQPPKKGIKTIEGLEYTRIIGEGAFYGCNYLTSAYIGSNVRVIRDYTFYGCESLTKVNIPYMLESIGTSAFYYCKNLRNVVNAAVEAVSGGFEGLNLQGCRVTDIGDFAFYNTAIPGVNLGDRLVNLGEVAFYNCADLTTVELPDTVNAIKYATFAYCGALKEIKMSANIQSVDGYAFYGCMALTALEIPDSVKSVGDYAFYNSGLETIEIGNGLESIGAYAFASSKLQTLTLPNGVKSISEYAFRDCKELLSVSISDSLSQVGLHAFYGCNGMTVYLQQNDKPDGWASMWNSSYRPEIWGCEMSEDGSYVVSVTVEEESIKNAFSIEAYTVSVYAPYRAGYYFVGWSTNKDATDAEYRADQIAEVPTGTKLYAIWAQ